MTQIKQYWQHIPRSKKTLLCLAGIFLSLIALYFILEAPSLSRTMQFRRAEKANLVGPCRILGTEEIRCFRYDDTTYIEELIVARDDFGVALYPCRGTVSWHTNSMIYRECGNEPMLLAYHTDTRIWTEWHRIELPLILFDSTPNAVQAEITLHLSSDGFQKTYTLTSQRQQQGYFRFTLPFTHTDRTDNEARALKDLVRISDPAEWASSCLSVPYQLRLYDASGDLLLQQELVMEPYSLTNSKT